MAVHKPFLNLSLQGDSHSCPLRGPASSFPLRRPFPTESVAYLISRPSQEVPLSCSPQMARLLLVSDVYPTNCISSPLLSHIAELLESM